jgi:hypothetical protein
MPKSVAAMFDEHVELLERAFVEQELERSRAVSLPLACWLSMRFSPPPASSFSIIAILVMFVSSPFGADQRCCSFHRAIKSANVNLRNCK